MEDVVSIATGTGNLVIDGGTYSIKEFHSNVMGLTVSGGGLTVAGTSNFGGGLTVSGGSLTLNGVSVVSSLTLSSGALNGTGAVTVSNSMTWSGGSLSGSGAFASNGTLALPDTTTARKVDGRVFDHYGSAVLNATNRGLEIINGGVFNNKLGATFDIQNLAGLGDFGATAGVGTFNNQGTLSKTTNAGETLIWSNSDPTKFVFNNTGTVNVNVGTLKFATSGADIGTYNVATGANLQFVGGARDLNVGSDITGSGNVQFSGGTFNVNGGFGIAATGHVTIGTGSMNFNVDATFANTLTLNGGQADAVGGTGNLTTHGLEWRGGADVVGTGTLTTYGVTNITEVGAGIGRNWVNHGTVNFSGSGSAGFYDSNNLTWNNASTGIINLNSTGATPIYTATGTGHTLVNTGQINKNPGSLAVQTIGDGHLAIVNGGVGGGGINVHEGTLVVGGELTLNPTSGVYVNTGATLRRVAGIANAGTISGAGTIEVGTGPAKLLNQGNINPGGAGTAGTLFITGDLELSTGSHLNLELDGTAPGQHDKLAVSGNVNYGGTLTLSGNATSGKVGVVTSATTTAGSAFALINGTLATSASAYTGTGLTLTLGAVPTFGGWIGSGDGTSWTDTGNWSTGILPGIDDFVTISTGTGALVLGSGNYTIKGFSSSSRGLTVSGGSLTVGTASTFGGGLTVSGGAITLNGASTLSSLNLTSGTLQGVGDVTVNGLMSWSGGTMSGTGRTLIASTGSLSIPSGSVSFTRPLTIDGSATVSHGAGLSLNGNTIKGTGSLTNLGDLSVMLSTIDTALDNQGSIYVYGRASYGYPSDYNTNESAINGNITRQSGTILLESTQPGPVVLTIAKGFTNTGTIELRSAGQGNSSVDSTSTLTVSDGTLVNAATGVIRSNNLAVLAGIGLTYGSSINAALDNQGLLDIKQYTALSKAGYAFQNHGQINLSSGATLKLSGNSFTNLTAGQISGLGTVDVSLVGNLLTNNGTISPGTQTTPTGTLSIKGDLVLASGSVVQAQIDSSGSVFANDVLAVSGNVNYGGTLTLSGNATSGSVGVVTSTNATDGSAFALVNGTLATSGSAYNLTGLTLTLGAATFGGWTGTLDDSNWTDTRNWRNGILPGIDDFVTINTGSSALVLGSGNYSIKGFSSTRGLTLSGGSLTIGTASTFGGGLTVSGGAIALNGVNSAGGALNVSAGTLTLSAASSLSANAGATWTGGNITGAGTLLVPVGQQMSLTTGDKTLTGTQLDNRGTVSMNLTGGSTLFLESGAALLNKGTLSFANAGNSIGSVSGGVSLANTGSIVKASATSSGITSAVTVTNDTGGVIDVQGGSFGIGTFASATNRGELRTALGSSLVHSGNLLNTGSITGAGTLDLAGSTLTNTGTIGPGTTANPTGALKFSGNLVLESGGTVQTQLDGSAAGSHDQLAVSGNVNYGGTLTLTGGAVSGRMSVVTSATQTAGSAFALINGSLTGLTPTYSGSGLSLAFVTSGFWSGAGDGMSWTDVNNWSAGVLPGVDDVVTVTGSGNLILGSGSQSIKGLTTSRGLSISGPATLSLIQNSTVGALVLDGNLSLGAGMTLTAHGGLTWTGTNPSTLGGAGTLLIPSAQVATVSGAGKTLNGVLSMANGSSLNLGALTHLGGNGSIRNLGNLTASNLTWGGTFTNALGGVANVSGASLSGTFSNAGTLNVAGTVVLTGAVAELTGGTTNLTSGGVLQREIGALNWSGGVLAGPGSLTAVNGGSLALTGSGSREMNVASLALTYANQDLPQGSLRLQAGRVTLNGSNTLLNGASFTLEGGDLVNNGPLSVAGSLSLVSGNFSGSGSVNTTGTGSFSVPTGSTVAWSATGALSNTGSMSLSGQTFNVPIDNQGSMNLGSGLVFTQPVTNSGTLIALSGSNTRFQGGLTMNGGSLQLNNGDITGNVILNAGTVSGTGNLFGNLTVGSATLAPGFSPGALTISGDLNLNANSVLNLEIGGTTQGTGFDYIKVNGVAALNGALNVSSYGGFSPAAGSTFTVMNFASSTGAFSSTTQPSGWGLSFVPGANSYALQAAAVTPPPTLFTPFTPSSPVALNVVVAEVSQPAPLEVLLERTVETVTVMDATPAPVQKFVSVKKVIEEEACQ
jgi:hypothetical protein